MIKNTNEKKNRIHNFTVLFYNKLAEINEETFPLGMITTEFLNIRLGKKIAKERAEKAILLLYSLSLLIIISPKTSLVKRFFRNYGKAF